MPGGLHGARSCVCLRWRMREGIAYAAKDLYVSRDCTWEMRCVWGEELHMVGIVYILFLCVRGGMRLRRRGIFEKN